MPRQRQTVAMLKANGSRHYTKEELTEREQREVRPPEVDELTPPKYLPKQLAGKFSEISGILLEMGLLSSLDGDCLARYLIAEHNYLNATQFVTKSMRMEDALEASKWASVQDKFFRQCRAAASDMGLTVTSRCRLEMPGGDSMAADPDADLYGD